MYLKKYIWNWNNHDWDSFFSQFPHLFLYDDYHLIETEIKIILRGNKEEIEANFDYLEELWILNGIWPFWFPMNVRALITWICPYFRYEWHDLMWAIWGTEYDRKTSDLGMIKYSFMSILSDIIIAIDSRNTLKILYKCFFSLVIRSSIVTMFYILVRIFGRFWSFRYLKNENTSDK